MSAGVLEVWFDCCVVFVEFVEVRCWEGDCEYV